MREEKGQREWWHLYLSECWHVFLEVFFEPVSLVYGSDPSRSTLPPRFQYNGLSLSLLPYLLLHWFPRQEDCERQFLQRCFFVKPRILDCTQTCQALGDKLVRVNEERRDEKRLQQKASCQCGRGKRGERRREEVTTEGKLSVWKG